MEESVGQSDHKFGEGVRMRKRIIKIILGDVTLEAALNDSATAELVWNTLPIEAKVSTWGDEIYFRIPVKADEEESQEVVNLGDVGYWPPGQALCLFFGPTPVSRGSEIRPASRVNVIGTIKTDPVVLKRVRAGGEVIVRQL